MNTPLAKFIIDAQGIRLTLAPNGAVSEDSPTEIDLEPGVSLGHLPPPGSPTGLGVAPLSYVDEDELFESVRCVENGEYDFSLSVPLTAAQFKTLRRASENPGFPFMNPALGKAVTLNNDEAWVNDESGRYKITGRLRFPNFAGKVRLDLDPTIADFALAVEVVTAKISYPDEFRALLEHLSEKHAELVLMLDTPTETHLRQTLDRPASAQTRLLHLRRLFLDEVLPASVATIIRKPVTRTRRRTRTEQAPFVTHPDLRELQSNPTAQEWIRGGPLAGTFRGYTPTTLPASEVTISHDTVENRYVKYRLEELVRDLEDLAGELPASLKASRYSIGQWLLRLEEFLADPFWETVGRCNSYPNTMVMISRAGYREFTEAMMSFDFGLLLDSDLGELDPVSGDLRPVFDLYEIWVFFQLYETLQRLPAASKGSIGFRRVGAGYAIDLKRGAKIPIEFTYEHGSGETVGLRLYFHYEFAPLKESADGWFGSYSTNFHPDFTLAITVREQEHWFHFDAKYRLERSAWLKATAVVDAPSDQEKKAEVTYRRLDLHTMHTYRDSLLGTRGSYVIYPGREITADTYVRHGEAAYRAQHDAPSIGAFPLLPTNEETLSAQIDLLATHILALIESAITCGTYTEELAFSV